ncbi:MAG TPA: 30S ribosomal protein S16 [Limnochordales bacterium]
MAVRIRLKRMGAKKQPFYRIVVADARAARDGRYIEQLGYYDPLRDPPAVKVDAERTLDWLSKGAQPSDSVRQILERSGVWEMWQQRRQSGRAAPGAGQAGESQVDREPASTVTEA